jgi:PAS domain S-box-containing protein
MQRWVLRSATGPETLTMPDQTILLVEDNAISRKMVSFALETKGYRVLAAPDGAAALALMAQSPQLVLLDLVLPDMSGYELAPKLREASAGPIAVLACSGFVSKVEEVRLSAAGFDDIITKPVEPSRLLQIVRAHLPWDGPEPERVSDGQRVLVADDDPVQLKLTMYRLERLGFRTTGAADGIEALERTRTLRPDLVLTDVMMPRLDGFGLCRALRDDPVLSNIPVVMATSTYLEREDRELADQIEADDFVIRTPELSEVIVAIRRCLARPRLPPQHLSEEDSAARRAEVEAERNRRVLRQLEKQATLNSGLAQRCASLTAELTVLSGMSAALCQGLDVQSALDTTLAACLDAGGISQGALYLLGPGGEISTRAFGETAAPLHTGELTTFCGRLDYLRVLLEQRRTLDLPRDASSELPGPIAGLLVPIVHGGTLLGGLFLVSSGQGRPPEQTAFAEGVASQISLALVLARSFDDRAASERRARESEALLRSIFDSIGDGVVAVDGEGRLTHCNSAAVAMFGAGPMDARASDWAERYGLYREDQVTRMPGRDLPLVRALRGESPDHVELYLRRPSVSEGVWLSVTARPLRLENGRIGGAVAAFRDITSEKATQGQLMVSDRMASVGMLAAGVAHEINNPLAAVLANLDCAYRDATELAAELAPIRPLNDLPETLRDGRDAAERVRQIVKDLKIFSRAEEDTRGPVDIRRVLESTFRMAWNEIRHRARLVKHYGPVPLVDGNESRLGQVFLNLVVNAAQAIPEGRADRNEIQVVTSTDARGRAVVEIRDTGPGMPPETLRRLFTPFFTTKAPGVGTGLGLAICQRIVTAIGGEITVESQMGASAGTVFRVSLLPASATAQETVAVPLASASARRGRVLLIDDDPMIGSAVRRILRSEHDVTILTSAQEGFEAITRGDSYDVIFCDMMMPVMTGMEFYDKLLASQREQAERIVFLTGGAFTVRAREFLDRIPNTRIEKPFDARNLRSLVNDRVR